MHWLWLLWLGLALVAGVVEIFTLNLVFLMIAGGALAGAGVQFATDDPLPAVLSFAAATAVLLLGVRPPLLRWSGRTGPASLTGTAALVGRQATVITEITTSAGEIKLAGEVWSARTDRSLDLPLEIGSAVRVVRIDGATAVVSPFPPHAALPGGTTSPDGPEPLP
jgi:membrane protein implicated in regulation of membrane protease activity